MAMGNRYDNNSSSEGSKQLHAREIYSFSMANRNGVDPSRLSLSFVLGMLKIRIAPKKPDSDYYDYDNEIEIFLTHTKAKMLLDIIKKMMNDPDEYNSVNNAGVNTQSDKLISFSNGKEYGISTPVIFISKIEDGKLTQTYAYQFDMERNYIVKNFDQKTLNMEKEIIPNQEIDDFCIVLEEYYKARTFAGGFGVHESGVYTLRNVRNDITSIMEKMGIERPTRGNYNRGGRQSYFDSHNNNPEPNVSAYRSTTLDDEGDTNPPEQDV